MTAPIECRDYIRLRPLTAFFVYFANVHAILQPLSSLTSFRYSARTDMRSLRFSLMSVSMTLLQHQHHVFAFNAKEDAPWRAVKRRTGDR